jgi:glutathione S-transferase
MVRVALLEKGFSFDERHIKLCDQYPEGENIDKDYLAINPLGTVPAIQIDGKTICGSAEIIYQLDKIDSNNAYSLYPNNVREDRIRRWVSDTTITDGVEFASTLGTIMPVFSSPLLQYMIKQLPFSSIMKILLKHPRKDRKMIFIVMYFGKTFFYNTFSHVDINLMCVFNRLIDLGLEETLSYKTPFIRKYWENLKSRNSYRDGILNYYTDKEKMLLSEYYKENDSSVLKAILEQFDKKI